MSKEETIEKALKDAERFQDDKYCQKKKFVFRAAQPLEFPSRGFKLGPQTEPERIYEQKKKDPLFETAHFNATRLVQADMHRPDYPNKWLNQSGFLPAAKTQSLNPYFTARSVSLGVKSTM